MHRQTKKPARQLRWQDTCQGRRERVIHHLAIDDLSRAQQHRGLVESPSMHHELNQKWRKSKKRHTVLDSARGVATSELLYAQRLRSKPIHLLITRRDVKSRTVLNSARAHLSPRRPHRLGEGEAFNPPWTPKPVVSQPTTC